MEKNPMGRQLKEILVDAGWKVVTTSGRELELDELSFLIGYCHQIVKMTLSKKAGK